MTAAENLKITRRRKAILNALRDRGTHPTADDIHEQVRRGVPHISLGTVYRNLAIMSEAGLVRQLDLGPGPSRFDGDLSPHYHVRCIRCSRVDDARLGPLGDLEETVAELTEYDVREHRLEFVGLCPRCRKSGASPEITTGP